MINLLNRIFRSPSHCLICLLLAALAPAAARAGITFTDVSRDAGIQYHGPTAASSWGDFNGDGWPDLWVSNHHGRAPSLYLNKGDGSFVEVGDPILVQAETADFRGPAGRTFGGGAPDFHGASWADFDNDGDQDLLVVTGAGAGRGLSANHLYVNEAGRLTDQAQQLGLDYPLGRGRTPLWLDVNLDGRLDALLMNHQRPEAPSALFLQNHPGFRPGNQEIGFPQRPPTLVDRALARLRALTARVLPSESGRVKAQDEFAQLADFAGDGTLNLVAYMQPTRIYAVTPAGLEEITREFELPDIAAVQDAAIEDFDGDGRPDWLLVRSRPWAQDAVQTADNRLQGNLAGKAGQPVAVSFTTAGEVTFELRRPWLDPTDPESRNPPRLFIGSRETRLADTGVTVSPKDPQVSETPPPAESGEFVSIRYTPATQTWTLQSTRPSLGYIVSASAPIGSLRTEGYKPSKGRMKNVLLFNTTNGFVARSGSGLEEEAACTSVAAGDFDNDMDIDIYLVCADPTQNQPNLLYENDGRGNFRVIPQAGGAAGSADGRGNQVAMADYDRDGFLDLFVTNGAGPPPFSDGPHQLFRNAGNGNHWLELDLHGSASNRDGIGAMVTVETAGKVQTRVQSGGMHSFSQNHARLHFGLGGHGKADRVMIRWPSGAVQELRDVPADRILPVQEPAGVR